MRAPREGERWTNGRRSLCVHRIGRASDGHVWIYYQVEQTGNLRRIRLDEWADAARKADARPVGGG